MAVEIFSAPFFLELPIRIVARLSCLGIEHQSMAATAGTDVYMNHPTKTPHEDVNCKPSTISQASGARNEATYFFGI
jgi:hypothetical protein